VVAASERDQHCFARPARASHRATSRWPTRLGHAVYCREPARPAFVGQATAGNHIYRDDRVRDARSAAPHSPRAQAIDVVAGQECVASLATAHDSGPRVPGALRRQMQRSSVGCAPTYSTLRWSRRTKAGDLNHRERGDVLRHWKTHLQRVKSMEAPMPGFHRVIGICREDAFSRLVELVRGTSVRSP
jgi:hypothetical protein